MYTEGIRKIFHTRNLNDRFAMRCTQAENAGYNALVFQGTIYIKVDEEDEFCGWIATCFLITDFQDVQT
jgi:hypothetical protein